MEKKCKSAALDDDVEEMETAVWKPQQVIKQKIPVKMNKWKDKLSGTIFNKELVDYDVWFQNILHQANCKIVRIIQIPFSNAI